MARSCKVFSRGNVRQGVHKSSCNCCNLQKLFSQNNVETWFRIVYNSSEKHLPLEGCLPIRHPRVLSRFRSRPGQPGAGRRAGPASGCRWHQPPRRPAKARAPFVARFPCAAGGAPVPHGRKPRTSVHAACRPAPPPARNASLPPAVRVRACAARCHLHRRPCLPVSSPRARGREPCSSWAVGITTQVSLQLAAPCSGRGGAWPAVSRCSRRARGPRGRR